MPRRVAYGDAIKADQAVRCSFPTVPASIVLFPRVSGPGAARFPTRMEQPWERGPLARIPGIPRLAARMRAGGPRSPDDQRRALFPARRRPGLVKTGPAQER